MQIKGLAAHAALAEACLPVSLYLQPQSIWDTPLPCLSNQNYPASVTGLIDGIADDTLSDFDASAWKTWQEGGDDQSAEIYAAADLLRNPESNNDWYGTQDADSEWAASKLEQQPGDDLYPTEGTSLGLAWPTEQASPYDKSGALFPHKSVLQEIDLLP